MRQRGKEGQLATVAVRPQDEKMPLEGLAVELERRLRTMEDFHVDTRRLGFFVDDAGTSEEDEWQPNTEGMVRGVNLGIDLEREAMWEGRVNDLAQDQMAARLDIPRKFWDRMRDQHPDILQENVRLLLGREPKVQFVRTLDGTVRAFLSNAYHPRDNYDLMDKAVIPAIREARLDVRECVLTDRKMYVKVLFPDVQTEVKKGDIVQAGIIIRNSEVGAGQTEIDPFLYRLICLNGMIAPVHFAEFGLKKRHVGKRIGDDDEGLFSERSQKLDDAAFHSMVYDLVKGSINGVAFARMVDKLKDLAGMKMTGDPAAVVERVVRQERFTQGEQSSIMRHFIDGGDTSAWGLTNAVTRAAQDSEGYDRQADLEKIGGEMMAWSERAWTDLLATTPRIRD